MQIEKSEWQMVRYKMGSGVEAFSTNIGDDISSMSVVTPAYQAHSTKVAEIPQQQNDTYGVDALITNTPGIAIGVRTADCVPILLYDHIRQAIAAIHSGWKGTAENIVSGVIAKMIEKYGSNPADIRAAIGPCIHVEAFEVGDEVYEAFCAKGYGEHGVRMTNPYCPDSEEKWHIDLPAICHQQLMQYGVKEVYVSPHCTYRDHAILYSYRYSKCPQRIISAIRLK